MVSIENYISIGTLQQNVLELGNCNIDFFNFCHCQVWNFKILNQSERNQNFAINFWKHRKRKQKLTKYIETERKQTIIPQNFMKFHLKVI